MVIRLPICPPVVAALSRIVLAGSLGTDAGRREQELLSYAPLSRSGPSPPEHRLVPRRFVYTPTKIGVTAASTNSPACVQILVLDEAD